jgi:hypothetical protein
LMLVEEIDRLHTELWHARLRLGGAELASDRPLRGGRRSSFRRAFTCDYSGRSGAIQSRDSQSLWKSRERRGDGETTPSPSPGSTRDGVGSKSAGLALVLPGPSGPPYG